MVEAALARLDELGYIDDAAYVRRRCELLAHRGYGDYHIRYTLERHGIPEELVDEALMALPENLSEEHRIAGLMEKSRGRQTDRLVRYLAGRGFPLELIMHAVGGKEQP